MTTRFTTMMDCLVGISSAEWVRAARELDAGDDRCANELVDRVVATRGEKHRRCAAIAVLQHCEVTE
ncbi:hypothetical protein [Streptomyces daliensis]